MTLFIDQNGLQIEGTNDEVMTVIPVAEKFRAFGWNVITIDGHSFDEIKAALNLARGTKNKPTAEQLAPLTAKFWRKQSTRIRFVPDAELGAAIQSVTQI